MIVTIIQIVFVFWAAVKILDFIIETFSVFGGDGISPADVMWWICRPISFRGYSAFSVPMLVGLLMWIALIVGTVWSVPPVIELITHYIELITH